MNSSSAGWAQPAAVPRRLPTAPASDEVELQHARKLFDTGDTIAAIEQWNRLLLKQPDHQAALLNRAQAYLVLQQHALALADLNALSAVGTGPLFADVLVLKGVAEAALGRQGIALQYFNQAWSKGKSFVALANKAMLLKTMGRTLEASELFKQLVLLEPTVANLYNLAVMQKDDKSYELCRDTASLVLRSNSAHAPSYALRGTCAYYQKFDEAALADLLRSHALAPDQAETHLTIAKILMRRGKREEGLNWMLKAASLYLQQGKVFDYQQVLQLVRQPVPAP